jgi:16S rRNA (guanine527-N7)-methyltransferase
VFHVKHALLTSREEVAGTLGVSRETMERLDAYAVLLRRWTQRINLIAATDVPTIWRRHIGDCLQLVPHIPEGAQRGIDLGSGAGLPGLILAIAAGISFDLVESDQRKAAFLREAARITAAPVTVHARRIENIQLQPADLVTARALAPLPALLALATPLLAPDGVLLLPKGASVTAELTAAGRQWHMLVEAIRSCTSPDGIILRITEVRPV